MWKEGTLHGIRVGDVRQFEQMNRAITRWRLHPVIARVAAEATARNADDMWSWAPGLELASIRHAGLEARLFRS